MTIDDSAALQKTVEVPGRWLFGMGIAWWAPTAWKTVVACNKCLVPLRVTEGGIEQTRRHGSDLVQSFHAWGDVPSVCGDCGHPIKIPGGGICGAAPAIARWRPRAAWARFLPWLWAQGIWEIRAIGLNVGSFMWFPPRRALEIRDGCP